jgi:hypothetical protein
VSYRITYTDTTGLGFVNIAAGGTNLFTAGTVVSQYRSSAHNFAASLTSWKAIKLRVFFVENTGGGSDRTYMYVIANAVEGTTNVLGCCVIDIGSTVSVNKNITELYLNGNTGGTPSNYRFSNVSLYTVKTAQVAGYVTNIELATPLNDMLPFQRYLPVLDFVRVGGIQWEDTAGVGNPDLAFADLTDGNLGTFATTSQTADPIGFDGDGDIETSLANAYYWTPGTLTSMPTIGIVKSLSSSKYKLASTTSDTVTTKFGDGTDSIKFDDVTSAIETGETIVTNVFSDDGTFEDGVDSVLIDTATTLRSTIELQ